MIANINPLDTFFFRDGKPFSMGAETWADSVFPPSPSAIYGALRSLWISRQSGGFSIEKNIEDSEKLEIKGIYFKRDNDIALIAPRDLVHEKDCKDLKYLLSPTAIKSVSNYKGLKPALANTESFVENFESGDIISKEGFEKYLRRNVKEVHPLESSFYVKGESKIGIGRNVNTRVTDEGRLYRVDFKRLTNGTTIIVDYTGLDFEKEAFIRFGGEGKAANIVAIESADFAKIQAPETLTDNMFRLILTTPSIFSNGWLPSWINNETFTGNYKNINLELISATLNRPLSFGGWDLKKREPKPMYRAVPAGTVYWFKYKDCSIDKIIDTFHQKSISDVKSNEGFGISVVGA
jgi:CRISPR-associated protein Cmr3